MDFFKRIGELRLELVICQDGHGVNGVNGSDTGGVFVE